MIFTSPNYNTENKYEQIQNWWKKQDTELK